MGDLKEPLVVVFLEDYDYAMDFYVHGMKSGMLINAIVNLIVNTRIAKV